jgi:hypothetical protein
MIDILKRFFSSGYRNGKASSSGQDNDRDVMVAVCACFWRWGASMKPLPNRKRRMCFPY